MEAARAQGTIQTTPQPAATAVAEPVAAAVAPAAAPVVAQAAAVTPAAGHADLLGNLDALLEATDD
jgi:hypothetical protein